MNTYINIGLFFITLAVSIFAFFIKNTVFKKLDEISNDIKDIKEKINSIEKEIPEKYVMKNDYKDDLEKNDNAHAILRQEIRDIERRKQ